MQKEIVEYIKQNKKGQRVKSGVLVAVQNDGVIRIGWSKCNFKLGDVFDKDEGYKLALARTQPEYEAFSKSAPSTIKKQIRALASRSIRYFKGAKGVTIPV